MSRQDIIVFINKLEREFPVNEWKINNIHVWPLIRIKLFYLLNNWEEGSKKESLYQQKPYLIFSIFNKFFNFLVSLIKYVYIYIMDSENNDQFQRKVDAVFLDYSTSRSFKLNNGMYNIFGDSFKILLNQLNYSCLLLEATPSNEYRIPRFDKSIFIQPALNFIRLKVILFFVFNHKLANNIQMTGYQHFLESLDPIISKQLSLKQIKKNVFYILLLSDFFKKILKSTQAKLGFVINYYNLYGMAFNLACKELAITSIDVQHGVQGDFHIAYGRWLKYPYAGYELLPQKFWCWSQTEKDAINRWAQDLLPFHQPIVGGNVYLHLFKDVNIDLVSSYNHKIAKIRQNKDKHIHILLTLQPGFGLPDLIFQTVANSPPQWFWWIRLHPNMLDKKGEILTQLHSLHLENFNVDYATKFPLYVILRYVDVHVTLYSTVVIEAGQFEVPSVVCSKTALLYYQKQVVSEIAIPAYTLSDIMQAIQDQANKKQAGIFENKEKSLALTWEKYETIILNLTRKSVNDE